MNDAPNPRGIPDIRPIEPDEITIEGAEALRRIFRTDPRGFLIETLRSDDSSVNGGRFQMSYSSLTLPEHYRDRDRWHVHRIQTDRFVVVLGEMTLALYDDRPGSTTRGTLEVIRMMGAPLPFRGESSPGDSTTYLVPIPPGVLHCIGNLSREPFLLQNYPTELYNPADEGRIPFVDLHLPRQGGTFDWTRVERTASKT